VPNPPTLGAFKDAGYFDGAYGEAFDGFLKMTNSPWPEAVDDPAVALFLLIVDLAINPTAGFPLDIESFENFIIDVDPGIRFMRFPNQFYGVNPNNFEILAGGPIRP